MAPVPRLALALPLPLVLTACAFVHTSDEASCRVGGVRLDHEHQETLLIPAWHADGLALEAHCGDVRVVAGDGETRVTATLREKEPGDAHLVYADGHLSVETASGAPAVIRDLTLHVDGSIPALRLSLGLGDVRVEDVAIDRDCEVDTGMGDVRIVRTEVAGALGASTGMGDVELCQVTCATGAASSGMGDVVLDRLRAGDLEASTGMGDVELLGSTLERLAASTGMGDVRCVETTYASGDLSTGMGSVTR